MSSFFIVMISNTCASSRTEPVCLNLMRMRKSILQHTLLLIFFTHASSITVKLNWSIDDFLSNSDKCGKNYVEYKDSCYYYSTVEKTMEFAYKDCLNREATLFIPNTVEEFKFVSSKIGDYIAWIGLFKKSAASELTWLTQDGVDVTQLPWIYNKLGHGWSVEKRCAYLSNMFEGTTYVSFDRCQDLFVSAAPEHYYICERNSSISIGAK